MRRGTYWWGGSGQRGSELGADRVLVSACDFGDEMFKKRPTRMDEINLKCGFICHNIPTLNYSNVNCIIISSEGAK